MALLRCCLCMLTSHHGMAIYVGAGFSIEGLNMGETQESRDDMVRTIVVREVSLISRRACSEEPAWSGFDYMAHIQRAFLHPPPSSPPSPSPDSLAGG